MEQLTKNQAVATSQEAVQNQNEPQLRDENAHNDKSVHGVLNPTYQAELRRDAVQRDIEAERKKRDFFFSSKRWHTRWPRDWSSDVCSSDLCGHLGGKVLLPTSQFIRTLSAARLAADVMGVQIGRASCRERTSRCGGTRS